MKPFHPAAYLLSSTAMPTDNMMSADCCRAPPPLDIKSNTTFVSIFGAATAAQAPLIPASAPNCSAIIPFVLSPPRQWFRYRRHVRPLLFPGAATAISNKARVRLNSNRSLDVLYRQSTNKLNFEWNRTSQTNPPPPPPSIVLTRLALEAVNGAMCISRNNGIGLAIMVLSGGNF